MAHGLKLGSCDTAKGKFHYRVSGLRPGTTSKEHRVPGGSKSTREEALEAANAFLAKSAPWEGIPPPKCNTVEPVAARRTLSVQTLKLLCLMALSFAHATVQLRVPKRTRRTVAKQNESDLPGSPKKRYACVLINS